MPPVKVGLLSTSMPALPEILPLLVMPFEKIETLEMTMPMPVLPPAIVPVPLFTMPPEKVETFADMNAGAEDVAAVILPLLVMPPEKTELVM